MLQRTVTHKLVFLAGHVGNIHVVGGRAEIFEFLASEDIDGDKMDLGVTVLAGLGGGHFDDLAGATLDDDETVLPQSGALHGEGGGGASIGALESVLMLFRQGQSDVHTQRRTRSVGSSASQTDHVPAHHPP